MESPNKRIKLEHPVPSPPTATASTAPSVPEAKIELEVEPSSTETIDPLPDDQQYQRRYLLRGHKKALSSVKFSPDGKYLASACLHPILAYWLILAADKLIKLWDSRTGEFIQNYQGHTKGISDIAWSPTSDLLASGSDDKTVRLWNVNTVIFFPIRQLTFS